MIVTTLLWPAIARTETVIAVLGDSLTAGYGLPADQAFPVQLQRELKSKGLAVKVINAGVSGDTTAGGRARLDWVLGDKPGIVILELGANDALRGIDPAETEANLDAMLTKLKARGIRVLLAGMLAPPNLGTDYRARFDSLYARLAAKHDVPLYPFFLEGVAAKPELNLPDGLHPTGTGVAIIVRGILPSVRKLMESAP